MIRGLRSSLYVKVAIGTFIGSMTAMTGSRLISLSTRVPLTKLIRLGLRDVEVEILFDNNEYQLSGLCFFCPQ